LCSLRSWRFLQELCLNTPQRLISILCGHDPRIAKQSGDSRSVWLIVLQPARRAEHLGVLHRAAK